MSTGMRGYSRHSIIQAPIRFEVSRSTGTTCSGQCRLNVLTGYFEEDYVVHTARYGSPLKYFNRSTDGGTVK